MVSRIAANCRKCGRERSHRECYPEQYQHKLVGKRVEVRSRKGKVQATGVVERVTGSKFGALALLDTDATLDIYDRTFWSVDELVPI